MPLPGVVLSIQDDDGNELRAGEAGEVCARAGNFMIEYWNKPEATEEVFRGGWYHTGDAGYLDDDGYLYLVDRVKDMIVTGGENVYSSEVENALASHPAVLQVAVIGIPQRAVGRGGARDRRAARGRRGDRGRAHRSRPRVDRRLQGAQERVVPCRTTAAVGRDEGAQARAPRTVLGRPRTQRELSTIVIRPRRAQAQSCSPMRTLPRVFQTCI